MTVTKSNMTKSRKFLNYRPKTDLKSGLRKYLSWHLELLKILENFNYKLNFYYKNSLVQNSSKIKWHCRSKKTTRWQKRY